MWSCHLSQQRRSRNCISTNRNKAFPVQSELHRYSPISIFTDQPEQLHYDQWGQWGPIKLWGFGVLICMRIDQSWIRSRTSLSITQLPSGSGSTLSLSTEDTRLHFLGWNWNTNKVSLKQSRQSEADRCAEQGRAAYRRVDGQSRATSELCCSTAVLYHNWAVCTE